MIFKRSKHVLVAYDGHDIRFIRPPASVMAGWLPRLHEIAKAADSKDTAFFLDSDAITEMGEQIAEYIVSIGDDERVFPADEIDASLTPSEVASLWALFVMRCQLGLDEKKP